MCDMLCYMQTHGTYLSGKRIQPNKPKQLVNGSSLTFGTGTCRYKLLSDSSGAGKDLRFASPISRHWQNCMGSAAHVAWRPSRQWFLLGERLCYCSGIKRKHIGDSMESARNPVRASHLLVKHR